MEMSVSGLNTAFHLRGTNNFCSEMDSECPFKECDFYQTLLNRMWKVPRRDVNKYEHSLEGQKCPIRTIYTPSER